MERTGWGWTTTSSSLSVSFSRRSTGLNYLFKSQLRQSGKCSGYDHALIHWRSWIWSAALRGEELSHMWKTTCTSRTHTNNRVLRHGAQVLNNYKRQTNHTRTKPILSRRNVARKILNGMWRKNLDFYTLLTTRIPNFEQLWKIDVDFLLLIENRLRVVRQFPSFHLHNPQLLSHSRNLNGKTEEISLAT